MEYDSDSTYLDYILDHIDYLLDLRKTRKLTWYEREDLKWHRNSYYRLKCVNDECKNERSQYNNNNEKFRYCQNCYNIRLNKSLLIVSYNILEKILIKDVTHIILSYLNNSSNDVINDVINEEYKKVQLRLKMKKKLQKLQNKRRK